MRVYADQAATTSLSKTALEAMLPWMTENFGNPSALYEEGRTARDAVETAREKIAHLLHAKAKEIYFTSGGTEADNWALQMVAAAGARIGKKHIIQPQQHCFLLIRPMFPVFIQIDRIIKFL